MTRAQGFARGDLDTSFPLDDKFLALRALTDPPTYYAASGVYFHVVAATWREADRKPASRIAPDATEMIALLVRVGLFDADECVTKRAYVHSIGRAVRARRTASDRKSRNRAGMSRGTDRDTRDRHAMSTDIQSGAVQSSTERSRSVQSGSSRAPNDGDPYDEAVTWLASRKAWVDSPKIQTDLARMVDKKGVAAVIAAMAQVPGAEDAAQFVYGARNALFPLTSPAPMSPEERRRQDARATLDAAKGQAPVEPVVPSRAAPPVAPVR